MTSYVCWGDDGEDLTEKVQAAIERAVRDGHITFGVDDEHDPVEIAVDCSKGHRNLFEV